MLSVPVPPKNRPGGLLPKVLLAWIAYHSDRNGKSGGKAEHQASHLHIQQKFRLTTPNSANTALKTLRKPVSPSVGPWIRISTKSAGVKGHSYALGPAAKRNADEWVSLGRFLFGNSGQLRPYLSRPIMLPPRFGISLNGCLTLAYLEKFGPLTQPQLVKILSNFVDAKTARRAIAKCLSADLILKDEDELLTPLNLRKRILEDEKLNDALLKARKLDKEIGRKQTRFQCTVLRNPTIERLKSILRKQDCYYCMSAPPPEGGEVEHFPPKRWGGSDELSLLLPICRQCNGAHGALLKTTEILEAPVAQELRVFFPGTPEEAAEMFLSVMMSRAVNYADFLNEGNPKKAQEEATSFFEQWIALKRGAEFVNSLTGERSTLGFHFDPEEWDSLLEELSGIPGALSPPASARRLRFTERAKEKSKGKKR